MSRLIIIPDKVEILEFIKDISHSPMTVITKWQGNRDMVDLHELVVTILL